MIWQLFLFDGGGFDLSERVVSGLMSLNRHAD
jgi:hypothetical protein